MRVAIAIPHSDYFTVPWKFAQSLIMLVKRMSKTHEVEVFLGTCSNVTKNRNDLLKLVQGFDACLMIDTDMTFTSDAGEKLLTHLREYDMACGSYVNGTFPYNPAIYKYTVTFEPIKPDGIQQVDGCGFGMVALGKKALTLTFEELDGMGEDLTFCNKATDAGLRIVCDSTVVVGHLRLMGIDINNRESFASVKPASTTKIL